MLCQVRQHLALYAVLWLTLTVTWAASAQISVQSTSRFSRLDIQQGLSQNTVTALVQDHDGNIWIGTQNGLNRYDGFDVKVFLPGEHVTTISDNFITSLVVDQHGVLWVGTLNGLNRYDPKRGVFERFRPLPQRSSGNDMVLSLHLDQQNRLWVGTDRGIALWQDDSQALQLWYSGPSAQPQNITAISADNDGRLWFGTPQGLYRIDIASKTLLDTMAFPVEYASVLALYHDKAGRLWAGLEHKGLLLFEPEQQNWQSIELVNYDKDLISHEIRSITMDDNADIWVGTQHGLNQLRLKQGKWQQQASFYHQRHNPTSLGSGKVVSVLADTQGSIWVGSWNGGVSRLNQANNLFSSITPDLPLMAAVRNPATITLAAWQDKLWAGTADGLFTLTAKQSGFVPAGDQQNSLTYYSALDRGSQWWFGHTLGISSLDKITGLGQPLPLPASVAKGPVRRMWADDQHVWLAIEQFGIVVMNHELNSVIAVHPLNRSVTFIRPLGQDKVLVGSYLGLSWFDRSSATLLFTHRPGITDDNSSPGMPTAPMDFITGTDNRYWLASNGSGLYEMLYTAEPAQARFVQYGEKQGLNSGQLKSIASDNQGNLWLSTAFGISVFSPGTEQFRNFGYRHGTLKRDYINASVSRLSDGSIVFGGMDGFTVFQPERVLAYQATSVAEPHIQSIQVNNAPLDPVAPLADAALAKILNAKHQLTVPAEGTRSISLSYSTREFIETAQVQFQYRLDPLDSNWITQDPGKRTAGFERLPPGQYLFRLRAGVPQSPWSDEYQLAVRVLPLWWETWWARLLLLLLLVAVLAGLPTLRLRQLHKRQRQLAMLVEERTSALEESKNKAEQTLQQLASTMKELVRTEKMAVLGQLVAGVAHEVNTPLGVALTASSVVSEESRQLQQKLSSGNIRRQELDSFLQKLEQATRLLDSNLQRAAQLVANFKQVSVDRTADNQRRFKLALYLDELLESLSLMWKHRDITFDISCPPEIEMDSYPGSIGQVITNFTQNAVVHAFKDSASGKISISCRQLKDKVEIVFADNGSGISKDNLERIFDPFFTTNRHQGGTGLGLHIVYNLVTQKLRGSITVTSAPNEGTCFTLLLPLEV